MKKGKRYFVPIMVWVAMLTILIPQQGGYLSQKLMVENNIRDRVKEALSKLIESHKYVVKLTLQHQNLKIQVH